ncbi:MAG: hypothetical protein SO194_08155, partial [Sodaliphilus sp.]|nr:hypothetical protein [Sodaliphilus sp.]
NRPIPPHLQINVKATFLCQCYSIGILEMERRWGRACVVGIEKKQAPILRAGLGLYGEWMCVEMGIT